MDMNAASDLLRLLGDETRLRLLRLLAQESLNVSELTAILVVAQSGVSRHLGLLKDAGLVGEQRSGIYAWYTLDASFADAAGPHSALWAWLTSHFVAANAKTKADDARLAEVRRVRRESFQATHGEEDKRQLVPGRSWAAWSRALGLLLPPLDVADLGCGEGYLTIEAARPRS
jgi:ArsR family transcriptional regulator